MMKREHVRLQKSSGASIVLLKCDQQCINVPTVP